MDKLHYPAHEIVCHCPAFPWPHAEFLSRRCQTQAFYDGREPPFPEDDPPLLFWERDR